MANNWEYLPVVGTVDVFVETLDVVVVVIADVPVAVVVLCAVLSAVPTQLTRYGR